MRNAVNAFKAFNSWAVIGVTQDTEKYGNIIYERLKACGKRVYGISQKYAFCCGDKMYKSVVGLKADVAVFVVNPSIGLYYLDEVYKAGIKNIWLQPGTFDGRFLEKAKKLGFNIYNVCVLVVSEMV